MPPAREWAVLKSYTCLDEQFVTLWRILKSRGCGKDHWRPRDEHANELTACLPSQLGLLTPHIIFEKKEIVLTCERGSASGAETFDMAKVEFLPKEKLTNVLLSAVVLSDTELTAAVHDLCERPLWYFIADCGTRGVCVFCPKPLRHDSSRAVGYGPDCAKRRGLYYKYSGPESARPSQSGVPDEFDYDSL